MIKINNGKKLKVKALIDSEYIHTTITRDIVKEKKIPTKMLKKSFDVYNSDRSRNSEKTIKEFVLLELNSNRHIKQIDTVVLEIKETDLFLEHNWLVEHNPEVNWKKETIWFSRYPGYCKTNLYNLYHSQEDYYQRKIKSHLEEIKSLIQQT